MEPSLEPLSKIVRLPRNPRIHDLGSLHQSFERFGFLQRIVVNDRTGRLIAGQGRIDALQQRKAKGLSRPKNIREADGEWMVPTDHVDVPPDEEEAAALALNRLGDGEYDEGLLTDVLADVAARSGLGGTGFDADDLDALLEARAGPCGFPEYGPDVPETDAERAAWATCPECGARFPLGEGGEDAEGAVAEDR